MCRCHVSLGNRGVWCCDRVLTWRRAAAPYPTVEATATGAPAASCRGRSRSGRGPSLAADPHGLSAGAVRPVPAMRPMAPDRQPARCKVLRMPRSRRRYKYSEYGESHRAPHCPTSDGGGVKRKGRRSQRSAVPAERAAAARKPPEAGRRPAPRGPAALTGGGSPPGEARSGQSPGATAGALARSHPAGNFAPPAIVDVGPTDPAAADARRRPSLPFATAASDGTVLGADLDALDAARASVN